jgi:inner membrane protein
LTDEPGRRILEVKQMATLYTHAFTGLGLAALASPRHRSRGFWILAALLPAIPDLDVFSPYRYGTILGHRGFTHSLSFALATALVATVLTFSWFRINFWALLAIFFVIAASHGFLDACTNGGEKIPFFWPFSQERFGRWGPIQVCGIGFEFPDPSVSLSVRTELFWVWLMLIVVGIVTLVRRRVLKARYWRQTPTPPPVEAH